MRSLLFAVLAASAFAGTASATITGGAVTVGDGFIKLSVPFTESNPDNTVGEDNFNTLFLYGFDESQKKLADDLNVDILASTGLPGTLTPADVNDKPIASHFIFFDPPTRTPDYEIDGTVEFRGKILAVIFSTDNLIDSNYFGRTGVTYLDPALEGLEAGDLVTILDKTTIRFNSFASSPGDYIRVLTVPTPATLALFGLGLVGLGLRRAR